MKTTLLYLCCILFSFNGFSQNDTMYIVLLAGQSNMCGRAPITPEDTVTYSNIFSLTRDSVWVKAKNPLHYDSPNFNGVGPGLSFAKQLSEKFGNNIKIGLVPCAVGGTTIEEWLGDSLRSGFQVYSNFLNRAKFSQKSGKIIGIIWHQGEQNALPENYINYKAKLYSFIYKVRNDLNNTNILFVAGELGTFLNPQTFSTYPDSIKRDLHELKSEMKNFSVASSVGLLDKGDKLHFGSFEQREFGIRYANELIKNLLWIKQYSDTVIVGKLIDVAISIDSAIPDKIISYQFEYNYDPTKLAYASYNTLATGSENGTIVINSNIAGKLSVAWIGEKPLNLNLDGLILKLSFKSIDSGKNYPTISNAVFNTNPFTSLSNSFVSKFKYGDIDGNNIIQAYDAALALHYSVGINSIPQIDDFPWESWRLQVANVDNIAGISASDASEILKFVIGISNKLPADNNLKKVTNEISNVTVVQKNGFLFFSSSEELYSLNITIKNDSDYFDQPRFLNKDFLTAFNKNRNEFHIAFATAFAQMKNDPFLKIPYNVSDTTTIEIALNYRNELKIIKQLLHPFKPSEPMPISIYPNPSSENITIEAVEQNAIGYIYSLSGSLLIKQQLIDSQINVSSLNSGIYIIRIIDSNGSKQAKFIKN